jgi:hypothetical protein
MASMVEQCTGNSGQWTVDSGQGSKFRKQGAEVAAYWKLPR